MAIANDELPQGFVVDDLPEGFTLDTQQSNKPSLLQNLLGGIQTAATPLISAEDIQSKFPISAAIGSAIPIMNSAMGIPSSTGLNAGSSQAGLNFMNPNLMQQGAQSLSENSSPLAIAGLATAGLVAEGKPLANGVSKLTSAITDTEATLQKAQRANDAIDALRKIVGKAKGVTIAEVADIPTELKFNSISGKISTAIKNPIYEIAFTPEGGVAQTVGNLDKVANAVGELIHTPAEWLSASTTEKGLIKKFYGETRQAMKDAVNKSDRGISIDHALDYYHDFRNNIGKVQKTLVDQQRSVVANKLKKVFQLGAEPAVKEAWKAVSNVSPEVKQVMGQMKARTLLKNILKTSGVVGGLGAGKAILN